MSEHLNERARTQLETMADEERRLVMTEQRWIGYEAAARTVQELLRLRERHRDTRTTGLAIVGPFRNGKTMVADKFLATPGTQGRPTYYYQVPTEPTPLSFLSGMIRAMGRIPDPDRRGTEARKEQLEDLLTQYEPRVFIFDDAHHAFEGKARKEFHTLLRTMGHRWDMSPVLIGDRSVAENINRDGELSTRLGLCAFRRWQYDVEFAKLLNSLVRVLPLRHPSELSETALAQRIFQLSEGLIGEIIRIVTLAAEMAVGDEERITLKLLDKLKYVPLSKRFAVSDLHGLA